MRVAAELRGQREVAPQLVAERAGDVVDVRRRMRLDRLEGDGAQLRVVAVPPPSPVGERDEVGPGERVPAREELVDGYVVRPVGLAVQEIAVDGDAQLA